MINTTKTKQACFDKYALDVTRVPDQVEDEKTKVQVRCLLHDGFYEVAYRELQKRRVCYSPGCPECKRYTLKGDRAIYQNIHKVNRKGEIETKRVFVDYLAEHFPLVVELHMTHPGEYDRPRSVSG